MNLDNSTVRLSESANVKEMDPREFLEAGYLQELNRRFLHPLGLALEVQIDPSRQGYRLGRIWDCRDDPEGVVFASKILEDEDFRRKKEFILSQEAKRSEARIALIGSVIQQPQRKS